MSNIEEQFLGMSLNCSLDDAQVLIGYHGGCVDGCAAAYMLSTAMRHSHQTAQIKLVAIGHQTKRFGEPGLIEPDMVVFSVDITPTMEDVEALQKAAAVVLLDHHTSELEIQARLVELCPNILNLCTGSGSECAASMVYDLVHKVCPFSQNVVSMVHKMDVFAHQLPKHLEKDFAGFRAYVTQKGERNVEMDLVENVFTNPEQCIADGLTRAALMSGNADALAASLEVIAETAEWRVLCVTQSPTCRPIDLMHYQQKLDEKITGKPTLIITRDENPLPNGLYNLGLRRAGDNLNITLIAAEFKTKSGVVGGGGHPFAGGVQSKALLTQQCLLEMVVDVMNTVMNLS